MARKKDREKSPQNSEGNKQDKNETNDEEPNFSDPEGFVDNISDEGNLLHNFEAWLHAMMSYG
jgi:translation initiation factor 3 subunit B